MTPEELQKKIDDLEKRFVDLDEKRRLEMVDFFNHQHNGFDSAGIIAGIKVADLLDKSESESISGGWAYSGAIVAKTAAYTATDDDFVITCDATGGAFTITLPATSGRTGRMFHIKKEDGSANDVTVDANASELIDDATTAVITAQYASILVISTGTEWFII